MKCYTAGTHPGPGTILEGKLMRSSWKKWRLPVIMLGPFLILVVIFYFIPVILTAILAFTGMDSSMRWEFIELNNFRKLLADPNIGLILKNTVTYVLFTLVINVFFGFILALLTTYFIRWERTSLFFRTI